MRAVPVPPAGSHVYAAILSNLGDSERPRILAVAPGRDQAAGEVFDYQRKKDSRTQAVAYVQAAKTFRSQMWLFRKRPEELTEPQAVELKKLFEQVPDLE